MRLPVSVSPVSEMRSTSMCAASAAPTTSPRPVTTLSTPSGTPASLASSASRTVVSGVARRRLEHDRVPGRERRPDLPDRHPHRVVPGADLADDADRLAPDEARVRAGVLVGGLALEVPDAGREEAQVVRGEREVRLAPELVGRPGLERLEPGELVGVAVEEVAEAVHDRDALGHAPSGASGRPERGAGGGDRAIDVRLGAVRARVRRARGSPGCGPRSSARSDDGTDAPSMNIG